MASARFECKRQMHVHPHVFHFEITIDRFTPEQALRSPRRTPFDDTNPSDFVLTNERHSEHPESPNVTTDGDSRGLCKNFGRFRLGRAMMSACEPGSRRIALRTLRTLRTEH